jgi:DNA-binding transcriptional LysR family regulator
MEITTRDIRYLLAVAHAGSLTMAARDCHVTEATLSKSISRVEEIVGFSLFDRTSKGMVLTQAGTIIYQHVVRIRREHEEVMSHAADLRSGTVGFLRVGVTRPIFDDVLSSTISCLVREHPRVEIKVSLDIASSLISMLQLGQLDMVFAPLIGVPHGELEVTRFGYDELAIVARAAHPIFRKRSRKLPDLLQYGWIIPPQHTKAASWLNERFIAAGLTPPKPCIEIDYAVDAILNLVEANDLLLLRSGRWSSRTKGSNIRRVVIADLEFTRPVYVIVRRGCYWSISMKTLANALYLKHKNPR